MSALSDLFTGIAAAIREKSGETATMKPAEFPEKIAAIETGGGNSYKLRTSVFKATDTIMTIDHNSGVVPDIIFFTIQDISGGSNGLLYALGFSSAMHTALGGGYLSEVSGVNASKMLSAGMDKLAQNEWGSIAAVTATSFTVGGKNIALEVDKYYCWYAISGIC